MSKNSTIQVVPLSSGWVVRGEGRASNTFSTQADAIKAARDMLRTNDIGQFVVLKPDGEIVMHVTHGLPKVQDPPGRRGGKKQIQNAAGRIALERFATDPHPPRG